MFREIHLQEGGVQVAFITFIAFMIVNFLTIIFGAIFWMRKPRSEFSKKVWFWVGLSLSLMNLFIGGFLALIFVAFIIGVSELADWASVSDYNVVFRWLSGFTGLTWIGWVAGAFKFMKSPVEPIVEIIKIRD